MVGSHEELYRAMETDRVDLVLNDQRRAFPTATTMKSWLKAGCISKFPAEIRLDVWK